jgi:predicted membrane-bound spermidine synthase
MMYERRHEPLASWDRFQRRVLNHFGIVVTLIGVSLGVGMAGYRYFQGMEWIDAFLNAAMLLGGMGPIETQLLWRTKLFAGLYALYAGLVVLVAAGILMAPVFHRFIHRFHLEEDEKRRGRP